jgi:hypothetical protein
MKELNFNIHVGKYKGIFWNAMNFEDFALAFF